MERTYYRDLEAAACSDIERRFGPHISSERLRALKEVPTIFANNEEFQRLHREATGRNPEDGMLGFSSSIDAPSVVLVEGNGDVPDTLYHELVHRVTPPEIIHSMPRSLLEGITELRANQAVGHAPEQSIYDREVRAVRLLEQGAGEETVNKALLEGNFHEVKAAMDREIAKNEAATEWRERLREDLNEDRKSS